MKGIKYFFVILIAVLVIAFVGYGLITDCPNTAGYVSCAAMN